MATGYVHVFNVFSEAMVFFSTNGLSAGRIPAWSTGGEGKPPLYTPASIAVGRVLTWNESPGHFCNGKNDVFFLRESGLWRFVLEIDGARFPLSQPLVLYIDQLRWQLLRPSGVVIEEGLLEQQPLSHGSPQQDQHFAAHPAVSAAHRRGAPMLCFQAMDASLGLYRSEGNSSSLALSLYYLLVEGTAPAGLLPFDTAWLQCSGAYFFLPSSAPITDPAAFTQALKMLLGPVTKQSQWLAWLPSPQLVDGALRDVRLLFIAKQVAQPVGRSTHGTTSLDFGNMSLVVQEETLVGAELSATTPALWLETRESIGSPLSLRQNDTTRQLDIPPETRLTIPLAQAGIGTWSFPLDSNRGSFYELFQDPEDFSAAPSAEVRYSHGTAPQMHELRYPVLLGALPDPRNPPAERLPMRVAIDPLNPTDATRTRFVLDLASFEHTGAELPVSISFRTPSGNTVRLLPLEESGFSLARRPGKQGNPQAPQGLYLTPTGLFEALSEELPGVDRTTAPIAEDALLIMCGVYGTEFLLVAEQDRLFFTGEQPAHGTHFPEAASRPVLDSTTSTNWLKLYPGPLSGKTFKGDIRQSYCVQASDTVYYRLGEETGTSLMVGARLGDLSNPDTQRPFPMAPYGLVYYSDPARDIRNPNLNTPGDRLTAYETQVLSLARRDAIGLDRCLGPLFFDMATLEALAGGYAQTTRGPLVKLNDGSTPKQPAGTWNSLLLARGPVLPDQWLRFDASEQPSCCTPPRGPFEIVSPLLSTALLSSAAFLVITEPAPLGRFQNKMQLGDFPFHIEVSGSEGGTQLRKNTVLIFKLSTGRTLAHLAGDVAAWTDSETFVGDGSRTETISAQIQSYIAEAEAASERARKRGAYDYYAGFLERVKSPDWTGLMALNVPLELTQLPMDLQALLGGLRTDRPLRGHHFGINLSQVRRGAQVSGGIPIDRSSLFALVHYEAELQKPLFEPFDFQVLKLNALFDNSILTRFESQIAFSILELFGDRTRLIQGGSNDRRDTNTIVIDGALQVRDNETSVVFATNETRIFEFPADTGTFRTVSRMVVNHASLNPISRHSEDKKAIVDSAFALAGRLGFNTRPTEDGQPPIDLFSFGIDEKDPDSGLGYSDYDFAMRTTVTDGHGGTLESIHLDLLDMQLDSSKALPRVGSLFATLPTRLVGFRVDVSPGTAGARRVTGTGLDGEGPLQFALELQLVMGTLGALSDQSPLQGSLLLGWQAAGTVPSMANKTGMLFMPPAQLASSGGFRLQGVFKMSYASLQLERPALETPSGQAYVFCLVLVPVDFSIVGLPLVPPAAVRSLTFFGNFRTLGSNAGTNLSWFVGEPDLLPLPPRQALASTALASQSSRRGAELESDSSSNLVVSPFVGVLAGIQPIIDPQATQVVKSALEQLMRVPLSTKTTLTDLYNGLAQIPVNYDPTAGVTVWVDLTFLNITFQGVFSDPVIYGGRLFVDGDPKAKGVWGSLAWLDIEIAYRKISDELGAWSANVTLPLKYRRIEFPGKKMTLYLPVVGVVIYTNGDWRVAAGWPFTPYSALRLDFEIKVIPVSAAVGFYLAKLRSADAPGMFGTKFAVIWRFGIGLAFGLAKELAKGPLYLSGVAYAFITFEGFLASKQGALTEYGVDYYWFTGQLGVVVYIWGYLDLKIIKASLYVEAALALVWSVETDHRTVLVLQVRFFIELSFRLLSINISFNYFVDYEIVNMTFGSGPEARAWGPTPPWEPDGRSCQLRRARQYLLERKPKQLDRRLFRPRTAGDMEAPVDVQLLFLLQTTAISDGTQSAPQCIASLVLEVKSNTEEDDFSRLVQGVGQWLALQYGGAPPLLEQLDRIQAKIDDGTFASQLVDCLSSTFRFVIVPSDSAKPEQASLFPMFPQLQLTYHGDIPFDQPLLPERYPAQLAEYFNSLANVPLATDPELAALEASGVPRSGAGVIFTDFFDMLGKQLVSELRDLAEVEPALTFEQALGMLGAEGYANIAGTVSRNSQSGLRLPEPGSIPFGSTLVSAYQLSRQQVALRQSGDAWDTTFQLSYGTIDVKSWVVFGTQGDTSVEVTMDPGLVLTEPIIPSWITTGGGFHQLPALRSVDQSFFLGDVRTWTRSDSTTVSLRQLPEALQEALEQEAPLDATVQVVKDLPWGQRGKSVEAQGVNGAPVLFIGLQLRPILAEDTREALQGVYQLAGTNVFTRGLLEELLLKGSLDGVSLNMLAPLGNSAYRSSAKDASIVLAKTNLSTLREPPSVRAARLARMEAPKLPTHAKLADVEQFLWLVWELSVVHTGGFFLYMEDLPAGAFQDGRADIAVLVSFGGQLVPKPRLQRWHNMLLLPEVPKEDTLGLTATRANGQTLQKYQPNHPGGSVGFEIRWPTPPTTPGLDANPMYAQKQQYLEALYSLLQYRVESLTAPQVHPLRWRTVALADALPSHWSLPIGQQQTENWTYRQTLAVARFLDVPNRYAGVGMEARFGVQLVDLFGNNLPTQHPVPLKVLYNDALLPLGEWPGLEATYTFSRVEGKNQALLHLLIFFQPQKHGESTLTPRAAADAREKYLLAKDQLEDPNVSAAVSTVLSPHPISTNIDGRPLKALLVSYINDVALPYLDAVISGKQPPLPEPVQIQLLLDRQYVTTLQKNIFPLDMAAAIWRDPNKVEPAIKSSLPSVQQVFSPVAPSSLDALSRSSTLAGRAARAARRSGSEDGDETLRAFAESFERAWAGFDGSEGLLKLGEGTTAEERGTGLNRQLWVVRWGAGAGIAVRFPNANAGGSVNDLPVYFSPIPLSTQLLTQKVLVRVYKKTWMGTGADVDSDQERTFSDIDLDVWGRDFLAAFQQVLKPEMATATATLAGDLFATLMELKEQLAGTIQQGLQNVLEVPGQSINATVARERFRQALLQSLTGDYTIASVVQIPAEVTVKDPPSRWPPQLYGGVGAPVADSSRVFSLSPARLATAPGRISMPYLLSTKDPAAQAFVDLELDYPVSFVEHDFNPERARDGYVPSSWLTLLSPLFSPAGGRAPLNLELGKNTIPIPLRLYPGAPTLPSQEAQVAMPPITMMEEAMQWAYGFTVALQPSAQDRLTLQLVFNQPPPAEAGNAPPTALSSFVMTGADDPPRPLPKELFEALARFTFEFPQIAPHLAQVPAAAFQGRGVEIAKKALERFESLVQGIADTWKTWAPPSSETRARALAGSLPNPNLPRECWTYVVDFKEQPDLLVTRSIESSSALPPWPGIEGYETPRSVSDKTGRYKAKASFSGALVVTVPGLSLLAHQSARTMAWIERNANLVPKGAPAGTTVNPAFIYNTAIVELPAPVVPLVDALSTIHLQRALKLSLAIDALFTPLIQSNDPSVKIQELRFDLDCAYTYELAKGDSQQRVRSSTPILLMREDVATPDNTTGVPSTRLAEIKQRLTNDLTHWHQLMQPNDEGARLRFSITVFSTMEVSTTGESSQDLPLARFRSLEVPVPKNDPGWWDGTP